MKDIGKMPNEGHGKAKAGGTNTGKTGGLKMAPADGPKGTMKTPTTKNPYPNGLS